MAVALIDDDSTRAMGELLRAWDHIDGKAQAAPLVFQSMLRHYARLVVEDDLGEELAGQYLNDYYYWHERIAAITLAEDSRWLDDQRTEKVATRADLFHDPFKEQLPDWITGTPNYGWFSDSAIEEHAVSELFLHP